MYSRPEAQRTRCIRGYPRLDPDDHTMDCRNFNVRYLKSSVQNKRWLILRYRLVFFFLYPNEMHVHRGDNEAPFAINSTVLSDKETRYPRTILSLCILHTCIWVLPAVVISILHPSMDHPFHPAGIFIGFCDFFLIRACIVLVTCIFPLQISEIIFSRRPIHESSLSPTTLALQMVAFILLSLSSKRNLGQPGDPWNITPPGHITFETRYRMGAWQWMNNMIFGFGQGLLLLIYLWVESLQWTSRGRIQNVDETTALL